LSWKDFGRALGLHLVRRRWLGRKERLELEALPHTHCDPSPLSTTIDTADLRGLFATSSVDQEWAQVEAELSSLQISESAHGVNPGDRRAIFYLLRGLGAKTALEIGTHVGASTVYTAVALARNCSAGESPRLTTVDITDVNDEHDGPWKRLRSTYSPEQMISKIGAAEWVTFITASSLDYFVDCGEQFDFIFLDGDHTAKTVYREIPAALALLKPGGVILLHDYFPEGRPLWANRVVLRGPWMAIERHRSEGARIRVLPFGELPWPTKENSRVSSLALLVGTAR
jgi:predicted O-methyltransferase YrrM